MITEPSSKATYLIQVSVDEEMLRGVEHDAESPLVGVIEQAMQWTKEGGITVNAVTSAALTLRGTMSFNQRNPAHKHLTAVAIDIYRATLTGESYEHAKRRVALELSTGNWERLDTVYDELEQEQWEILNETTFILTAPDRALILAALRCLQEQIERVGERHFWQQHGMLGKIATNDGAFSLPGVASINELCPRISGLAARWEAEGESPQSAQAASEEGTC